MRRQFFAQTFPQHSRIQRQTRLRHQIPHKLTRIAACRRSLVEYAGMGNGMLDIRQLLHHPVNLAELNALSTNFKLVIAAPEVFHRAIFQPARHISGTVHTFTDVKRIGDKAARRQIRTPQIALRQLDPRQIQVARYAERHRAHHGIQNA